MLKAAKYILTVLVIGFMVLIYLSGVTPQTSIKDFSAQVAELEGTKALSAQNEQDAFHYLGITSTEYPGFYYWRSSDGMDASEVVVAQCKDQNQVIALKKAIEKRVKNQLDAFAGYAPEQEDHLKKHLIKTRGDYLLYAVGTDDQIKALEATLNGI
ncbi:MAG: DUF4358 domain-containing protein [Coriobacteriales bacterium]|nr:DUF4358 domain-containing protein [Coriobacteriales bacterium]